MTEKKMEVGKVVRNINIAGSKYLIVGYHWWESSKCWQFMDISSEMTREVWPHELQHYEAA